MQKEQLATPPPGCSWHHFDENGHIPWLMGTKTAFSCMARTVEKAMDKFRKWKNQQQNGEHNFTR